MLVVAHRGANTEALENSWESFARCIESRADRIELDIHADKDGELHVIHESHLLRTAGADAFIGDLSTKDVNRLRLKNAEPIPSLREVLARLLPVIEINIEIKGTNPLVAERAAQLVHKTRLSHRVIFSCFEKAPLLYLADHHPQIQRAVLVEDHDTLSSAGTQSVLDYAFEFLREAKTTIFHPHVNLLNRENIKILRQHQLTVIPWVPMRGVEDPNPEGLWAKLIEFGIDGLCTNHPRALRNFLTKQG